jgi:membrane protease subunit HflK
MAWNQPDKNQGTKQSRASKAGGLQELFQRLQQRLGNGGGASNPWLPAALAGTVLALWLLTGVYQIDQAEVGVVQRFGRFSEITGAGAHMHLPAPLETVTKVNISSISSIDYQSRMLTSDVNLVSISCAIQYQYADAQKKLFKVRDPESTLREVSESAIREIVGQNTLEAVLAGEPRRAITANTRDLIQKTLDGYNTGIHVVSVNLTDVQVPEQVLASQRDTNKAKEDRERFSKEAQGYANDLVPKARGNAQRQLLDAEAYKLQVVAAAEGDASRFTQLLAAYTQAPEVTRNRLYVETMESVLSRSRKVFIDAKSGSSNMLYLPLDKLLDAAGRSGASVVAEPLPGAAPASAEPTTDPRSRERGER